MARLLVFLMTERNSPSQVNTMSRRTPQPPRKRPAPPESARISSRSKRIPLRVSITSIGVLRATVWHGWLRGPPPSCVAVAPHPMASLLLIANSSPVSGWVPTIMNPGTSPPEHACDAVGHALRHGLEDQLDGEVARSTG